jgi:hypothetical protein
MGLTREHASMTIEDMTSAASWQALYLVQLLKEC